jgi:hypothetical protein
MNVRDYMGERGETIFRVHMTDFCGNQFPYFSVRFLGEKCPTFDYLVELISPDGQDMARYFLVQVKATGSKSSKSRLGASVSASDVRKMAACPMPTYVVGVDTRMERAYIVAVHSPLNRSIRAIPRRHRLNSANLKKLWHEINQYWESFDASVKTSKFTF